MNYMSKVAEMLGVELGERFKIEGYPDEYWLADDGLHWIKNCKENIILVKLLTGESTIVKKPWKPKNGEVYYFVMMDGAIISDTFNVRYASDITKMAFGNCFRTQEDARRHKDEMLAKMREVMNESYRRSG